MRPRNDLQGRILGVHVVYGEPRRYDLARRDGPIRSVLMPTHPLAVARHLDEAAAVSQDEGGAQQILDYVQDL